MPPCITPTPQLQLNISQKNSLQKKLLMRLPPQETKQNILRLNIFFNLKMRWGAGRGPFMGRLLVELPPILIIQKCVRAGPLLTVRHGLRKAEAYHRHNNTHFHAHSPKSVLILTDFVLQYDGT